MKKLIILLVVLTFVLAGTSLMAQPPAGGGAPGAGRGGGGAGRGAPAPPPPTAPQPLLDFANNLVTAINAADAATVKKMVAADAIYLDEDGHAPPVARWIANFTDSTKPKAMTIKMVAGNATPEKTALGAMTSDTSGWISFVYSFPETVGGKPVTVTGTCSMVLKKTGSDWQAVMIHGALYAKIAGLTGE